MVIFRENMVFFLKNDKKKGFREKFLLIQLELC